MRIFRRRPIGTDANEIAMHVAKHSGGSPITAIGTVIALVFSAYSVWETSLKQAKLEAYVTGVVTYTRDATDEYLAPVGGFEVFAVPVTIATGTTLLRASGSVASRFSFRPKRVPVQSIVVLVTAISSEVRAETRMSLSRSRSREGIVYLSFRSNFDAFHRVS
jgi:hypothetical protein